MLVVRYLWVHVFVWKHMHCTGAHGHAHSKVHNTTRAQTSVCVCVCIIGCPCLCIRTPWFTIAQNKNHEQPGQPDRQQGLQARLPTPAPGVETANFQREPVSRGSLFLSVDRAVHTCWESSAFAERGKEYKKALKRYVDCALLLCRTNT